MKDDLDHGTSLEAMLASIRDHVLEDVWIGGARRSVAAVLACGLAATALFGIGAAYRDGQWVAVVSDVLFISLSAFTLIALYRTRFKWCCAAAYSGGLATVAGAGGYWWHHTAHIGSPLPAALSTIAAAALTAHWLSIVVTPVDRSQPDMRAAAGNP